MKGFFRILKSEMFHGIHFENEQALINKIEVYIFNYNN
ncbi:MAG: IS3 family transposase [Acholeplasmatales bacterium]|nr:IS3 family transposase [Acholeplasmatales bacterium]